MALPINDIELAWDSLRDSTDTHGWRSIPIAAVGTCALRAGCSFPNKNEALLASFSSSLIPSSEKFPEGRGFDVTRVNQNGDEITWLALTRNSHGNLELFSWMVADVIRAITHEFDVDERNLLRIFLGRIRAWQEFMRKGTQVLSPEAEIGLIGELILLRAIIDAGISSMAAIDSWLGPLDGIQDFELGTGALEVKSTLSSAGFPAKIGSLEQLDDSVRQPLFVAGVKLKQTVNGKTLPEIVEEIRIMLSGDLESERLLIERLLSAGYIDAHSTRYTRQFEMHEIRIVRVTKGFPRLTMGNVPPGIMKTMYEIDLDKVLGENACIEDALRKMGAI